MGRLKDYLSKKIEERDIEFFLFVLFFVYMGVYYFLRIFKNAPWYDELYTYYYFISNGPIYSAIHWPVPNNHIGYSVLSGIVYVLTHNSFIALRFVSYIAALANIILLYIIGRKIFIKNFSLPSVCLYVGMWLVNNLSIQGRGYTLATTMMLLCIFCMIKIALDNEQSQKYYVLWAISLCMGLYIVPSSLYWLIPVCLCMGISLLIFRKYKELLRIVIYSLFSAAATLFLYLVVWMAIGSNLLIKEIAEFSSFGHVKLIMDHPIKAAKRGIDYMLATPYIQSVQSNRYRLDFEDHWIALLKQMYGATAIIMIGLSIALITAGVFVISFFVFCKKNDAKIAIENEAMKRDILASLIVDIMLLITPIIVMIQRKLPYFRVFSFYGVAVSISLIFIIYVYFRRTNNSLTLIIPILFIVFAIAQLSSADYNVSYGLREDAVYALMTENDLSSYRSVAVTDCDQEYMYKFVYNIENDNRDIINSEAVILEKSMLDPDAETTWEFYYDYSSIDLDDIQSRRLVYENDFYALYVK